MTATCRRHRAYYRCTEVELKILREERNRERRERLEAAGREREAAPAGEAGAEG